MSRPRAVSRRTAMYTCNHIPFPGDGAYGQWHCQRRRFHLGWHRFNNYTTPRVPQVWRIPELLRRRKSRADWEAMSATWGTTKPSPLRYTRILRPATYRPIDRRRRAQ